MASRILAGRLAMPIVVALALAVSLSHAQTRKSGKERTKSSQPNAHMTVEYQENGITMEDDTWSKPVFWDGKVPSFFSGTVDGQQITWIGKSPAKNSIRLDTTSTGKGGHPLERTFQSGTTGITILIERPGKRAGAGQLTSQSADTEPKGKSKSKPSLNPSPKRSRVGRFRPSNVSLRRQRAPSLSKKRTRTAHRAPSRTSQPASENSALGTSPSVKNKKHSDKPASLGDGRDDTERAKKQRVASTGVLKGKRDGSAEGKAGGATAQQGGISSPTANPRGKGTVAHGMKGGTGAGQGLPSGGGIWPLIVVPASLRHATSTLLIMKDANAGQLAANWMSKMGGRATVYRLRKRLSNRATEYARARLASHTKEIDKVLKGMGEHERDMAMNRWRWEIQRQYFARMEHGAAAKLREAGIEAAEKRQAEMLLEAAKVKPIAGQLPRNHRYAGKGFPIARLPSAYRSKGLRFAEDGFPDFGPHAQTLPNGRASVTIKLSGNYTEDVKRANKAAGYTSTNPPPNNLAWHHHQDGVTMQLVPRDLHRVTRHTGGRAVYKHTTGDSSVYP